jgi:hypothetical protein
MVWHYQQPTKYYFIKIKGQIMTRQHDIAVYGIAVVQAKEAYWLSQGFKIDYSRNLLIKLTNIQGV